MSQSITTFRGDKLYLDTNTFYLFLRAITPQAQWLYRILVKLFLADFDRTDLLENNVYVR